MKLRHQLNTKCSVIQTSYVCLIRVRYLNFGQDGHDGGSHTQQHVDTDEGLVLSAAVSVGVVDVEHHQRH